MNRIKNSPAAEPEKEDGREKEDTASVGALWRQIKDTKHWGPTLVRSMNFFTHPMMHRFLKEEESLKKIRQAAFIDNGTVKRK